MSNFSEMVRLEKHLKQIGLRDSEDVAYDIVTQTFLSRDEEEDVIEIVNAFMVAQNMSDYFEIRDEWGV